MQISATVFVAIPVKPTIAASTARVQKTSAQLNMAPPIPAILTSRSPLVTNKRLEVRRTHRYIPLFSEEVNAFRAFEYVEWYTRI